MCDNTYDTDGTSESEIDETVTVSQLEEYILNDFDAEEINQKPKTVSDLLRYYKDTTDYLYQYLRCVSDKELIFASNELRAALGHIAEYRINNDGTKNDLEKAYGHFRRMTLDILKVICDVFDDSLLRFFKKACKVDFRNVDKDFLKDYSQSYFKAKQLYLSAQADERTGADSDKHNVIEKYLSAAKEYIKLKRYKDCHPKIQTMIRLSKLIKIFVIAMCVIGFISDAYSVFNMLFCGSAN